jgi:hypothetical protein
MYYAVRYVATSSTTRQKAEVVIPVLFKNDITRLDLTKIAKENFEELFGKIPFVIVGVWQIKSSTPVKGKAEIEVRV